MRVADSQFNLLMSQAMMNNNAQLNKVAEQLATGNKINYLSDNPTATVKLEALSKSIADNQQYQTNIENVQSSYDQYETYMNSLNEVMMSVNDLLLQGKNGTLDAGMRDGIVTSLEALKSEALTTLNAKHDGSYLFSGTAVDSPAIETTPPYAMLGNTDQRHVQVSEGTNIPSNFTASHVLGNSSDFFNQLDAVIEEFKNPTDNFATVVDSAIDITQSTQKHLLTGLGTLGANYSGLDRLSQNSSDLELFATTVQTGLVEVDYAQASMELNQSMLALQATQKTFTTISNNSLFDLL